jgi:choline dehydrogenase-like flavoprotein
MEASKADLVVDANQRSWDHPNLYPVGSGPSPTVASGNPTMTLATPALRTAAAILSDAL